MIKCKCGDSIKFEYIQRTPFPIMQINVKEGICVCWEVEE